MILSTAWKSVMKAMTFILPPHSGLIKGSTSVVAIGKKAGTPYNYNPSLGTKTGAPSAKIMSLPARSEYSPFWPNPEKRLSLPALAIR